MATNRLGWRRSLVAWGTLWVASAGMAADLVVLYPAFGYRQSATVEGRVTELEEVVAPDADDRRRDNFSRAMELMSNDERKGVAVKVLLGEREWRAVTDDEGYFRVVVTDLSVPPGWHRISAQVVTSQAAALSATIQAGAAIGESQLLMASPDNVHGIISDVDDTIQVTEVNSTRRMLANTFLQNPLQRQVVDSAPAFYKELCEANVVPTMAPMFYLSASPRQLHGLLELFLEKNAFPHGVLITKRVTNDSTSDPLRDQFAYKTAKLEEIFTRLPHARFTLLGDDGEADPEIFAAIRTRYPDRVADIWIRHVNPDPNRARLPNQKNLNERLAPKKTPQ